MWPYHKHVLYCAVYSCEKLGNGHFDCFYSQIKECNKLIYKRTRGTYNIIYIK